MLSIKNLTVAVGKKKILKDFSFTFERGKTYAIMGPNGSGKSTLAMSVMGHPVYKVNQKSKIKLQNDRAKFKEKPLSIVGLDANKRAEAGLFMSFQTPLALAGVTPFQMLQLALSGKKDPLTIREETQKYAHELKITEELLTRSLNEGASGGERKKLEVLQGAVLGRPIMIFDEIDTGVDVDALRTISKFLAKHQGDKTYILITHYNRILKYLKPDQVLVMVGGQLRKVGDHKLAKQIEKDGYGQLEN